MSRDGAVSSGRRGFTVALVGPDGAGKTTVARLLEHDLDVPARYLYMGVSAASSNRLLPTTRLAHALKRARGAPPDTGGPPDPASIRKPAPATAVGRIRARSRAALRLANQLAEEWYRQALASSYVRRGDVVLFDRHFFCDYHAYDVTGKGRPLARRIHGFVLSRLYPKPDLVVYLDAPADVLLARKGEGTFDALDRRRADYRALAAVTERFAVVDAAQPVDAIVGEVAQLIYRMRERPSTAAGTA